MRYKDPKQPVDVRVKDLMSRMTLAEKIGQMSQIDRVVASAEVVRNYYIGINITHSWYTYSLIEYHLMMICETVRSAQVFD